jgi:hypothetical protein
VPVWRSFDAAVRQRALGTAGPDGTIGFGAGRGKAADTTPGKVGSASAASAEPPAAPESAERFGNAERAYQ